MLPVITDPSPRLFVARKRSPCPVRADDTQLCIAVSTDKALSVINDCFQIHVTPVPAIRHPYDRNMAR